ncbi:hypothetical protein, partial [Stenotrophomonas maltophilia]|uniref:hypothetical protein n=1 Tax=Stenotrophomonas maltophilia TaxID=40324 RepID=UPI002E7A913F
RPGPATPSVPWLPASGRHCRSTMGERVVQRRAHRRHLRVVALLWRRDTPPGPAALWWADALG